MSTVPGFPRSYPMGMDLGVSWENGTRTSFLRASVQPRSGALTARAEDLQTSPRLPDRTNDLSVSVSIRGFGPLREPC